MTVSIKPRRVDEGFDEYFRELVRPRYEFIDQQREQLAELGTDEAEEELKGMITTEQKIENVLKLVHKNYCNDNYDEGSCSMCQHRFKCKAKNRTAILDEKGDLLPPAYEVLTSRCSLFKPLKGYGKNTDYKMFTDAHSTTTTITDTTTSGLSSYSDTNYTTVRTAASGGAINKVGIGGAQSKSGPTYYIYRGYCVFDGSALSGTISGMTLKGYCYNKSVVGGDYDCYLLPGNPQGTYPSNPVVATDYSQSKIGSGVDGTLNSTSVSTSAWNDFAFSDVTGYSLGGDVKFYMRSKNDYDNTQPTAQEWFFFEGPTNAGGNDPKLEVTYESGNPAQRVIWWM